MPRSLFSLALLHAVLCAPADDGVGAGGGGAPTPLAPPAPSPSPPPSPSPSPSIGAVELEALRAKAQQADALAARVKDLEAYETDAKAYRASVTEELKAIETEKASLAPAAQAALDAAPTLAGKKAVLAALRGTGAPAAPGKPVHTPSPASGAPAPNTPVDFDTAFKSGVKALDEAKAKDPTGFKAWEGRVLGGGRPASSLDTIFAPKKR